MSQLILEKVLDIKIFTQEPGLYCFYVPIKTGALSIKIRHNDLPIEFCEFLDTILKTEIRRFGENPISNT